MKIGAHQIKPCGKYFDRGIYIHKDYADQIPHKIDMDIVNEYIKEIPSDFKFDIIRYDRAEKKGMVSISFMEIINFDTADMPVVGNTYRVNGWGFSHFRKRFQRVRLIKGKDDPQIKIHKWVYVPQDYPKFDWNAAVSFSKMWTKFTGYNGFRGQKLSEWVTFLNENNIPLENWMKNFNV
jgi:hypothetical protein